MTANRVPPLIAGPRLQMRAATLDDAPFILSLRLDPEKKRHLGATSGALDDQVAWMKRIAAEPDHRYLIVETADDQPIGTLRLLVEPDDHFGAHSMIIADDAPTGAAREVALMVYRFALEQGLEGGRFETRLENVRAQRFFERIGAVAVGDDSDSRHYRISVEGMRRFVAEWEADPADGPP